jgi:hypothetical protein
MENSQLAKHQTKRKSGDNIEYMYLDLPEGGSLTVPYESADYSGMEELEDGYEIHHVYLDCEEIQEVGFPLEANPREPASSRQVKSMRTTLREDSEDFVKKNNGVVVICSNIDEAGSTVDFEFIKGEGICNGGHTYFAIQTTENMTGKAQLHLEVLVIPDDPEKNRKDIITDIAKARNNSNELEDRSQADFNGYYDIFQTELVRPDLISWRENDSDAYSEAHPIDAVQFLRLVKSLDVTTYSHPVFNDNGNTHKSLATSRSRFHGQWMDKVEKAIDDPDGIRPLRYLLPLVNDIMYIRDVLSYTFPKRDKNRKSLGSFRQTNLFRQYISNNDMRPLLMGDFNPNEGLDLQNTLEVLFMGLFRSNIYCSPNPNETQPKYVGWIQDPEDLWYDRATTILDPMADLFTDLGDDPKQFIRISSPFNNSLYQFGMDKKIRRPPEVICDVESGTRYEKVNERDEAGYWLAEEASANQPVEIKTMTANVSNNAAMYRTNNRWSNKNE